MMSRRVAGVGMTVLAISGCVTMNPSVVDPSTFLGDRRVPVEVYASHAEPTLLALLDVRIDPMERLFLVNFAGDPTYEGVEIQRFPGAGEGDGVRVLLWRPDRVDVYDPPSRIFDEVLDRRTMEALLSPRAVTLQRASFDHRFRVTEHGLDAAVRIRDRDGREIDVEVVETRGTPSIGALIAPLGASSSSPDFLPLFFLDEFALVKRSGTEVRVSVDGQERELAKMTRLMKGPAAFFTRYSNRVVIAHWNERRDVLLEPIRLSVGTERVTVGRLEWVIQWNERRAEIRSVVAREGDSVMTFHFSPALPEVQALRPGSRVEGRFVIDVNNVAGVVAGEYAVERVVGTARLVIQPLKAWQPPIVRGAPWVASYRYEAEVDLQSDLPRLRSRWIRR